jgi:hypothetical protein
MIAPAPTHPFQPDLMRQSLARPTVPPVPAQNRGIWSDLPMATGIATLVCYAGVFGDVIGVEEIATRLGAAGHAEFYSALNRLHRNGKIILRDGFAALPDLEDKIRMKGSKIETASRLISSRMEELARLGRNPLIKFVGISGSLAASNPTRDRNNELDLDVFLITRSQCIWLYVIPMLIRNAFPRKPIEPNLCANLIMDESHVEIFNRNFYTATEIRNLIPVSGLDAYRRFLQVNSWVDRYYPGFSGASVPIVATRSSGLINQSLYVIFGILRGIKRLSLKPLQEISSRQEPMNGINFNRLSTNYGGYQAMVNKKFTRLAVKWFPDQLDSEHIEKLFPDDLSAGIRKGSIDVFKMNRRAGRPYDYSKYA